MTRQCEGTVKNGRCRLDAFTGERLCYWCGRAKPNAERWHAQHNARLSMMMGQQPVKDAPLNTERWR